MNVVVNTKGIYKFVWSAWCAKAVKSLALTIHVSELRGASVSIDRVNKPPPAVLSFFLQERHTAPNNKHFSKFCRLIGQIT